MNLTPFLQPNIFAASTDLFAQLGIVLKTTTSEPIPPKDALQSHYKDQPAFQKMEKAWFVGLIQDETFSKQGNLFSKEDTFKTAIENGKNRYNGLIVMAVQMTVQPTRTELSTITRAFNRLSGLMPMAVLFRYQNETGQTLISMAIPERFVYKRKSMEGEKVGKVIVLKDISVDEPHSGHLQILADLNAKGVTNYDALQEKWLQVLNVELLNERFYKKLSNWFFWALPQVEFPADEEPDADVRKATSLIRLITRVIFVWFMKEKKLVDDDLFDETKLKQILKFADNKQSTYYKAILQNLFFATLNTEMGKRKFRRKYEKGRDGQHFIHNVFRYEDQFLNPDETLKKYFEPIPFLNGGLFECLDTEREVDGKTVKARVDGFSDLEDNVLTVNDTLFFQTGEVEVDLNEVYGTKSKKYKVTGLINLLKNHKFTIVENTPLEEEVALDPELLGRVFENLLASYNEETRKNARNQSGSFYTPREIVDYMVDESLAAYLESHLKAKGFSANKPKLESLISIQNQDNPFENQAEIKALIEGLDNCKILDPACGSGAFPMGVLHKMVHILHKLDPKNALWKQRQISKAEELDDPKQREETIKGIEDAFENNELDYGRKLYLIENCIYGIDIQPIAVQISKLRFFISLLVDQKAKPYQPGTTDNRGVMPLPNLETKFVAANSLVALLKPEGIDFRSPSIIDKEEDLKKNRHRYFSARNRKAKKNCQEKDKEIRGQIIDELEESFESVQQSIRNQMAEVQKIVDLRKNLKEPTIKAEKDKFVKAGRDLANQLYKLESRLKTNVAFGDTTRLLSKMDLFSHRYSAPFFDAEYMFGVVDGFDVVIGNPPYVQIQVMDDKVKSALNLQNYASFDRTGDIYCLFYEMGLKSLKTGGVETFITSSQWMKAAYGENLRNTLSLQNPLKILALGPGVFKSATVDTNILVVQKGDNKEELVGAKIEKTESLSRAESIEYSDLNFSGNEAWLILDTIQASINEKIQSLGKPLKLWDLNVYFGVKTGLNEVFIISEEKRKELVEANANSESIIRPILRGREIERYWTKWEGDYVIATFPALSIEIEEFDSVYKYLSSFRPKIDQIGLEFENEFGKLEKTRKRTGNEWFETQDQIAFYLEFSKPKIIWKRIGSQLRFTYSDEEIYSLDSTCFATGEKVLYLTALLNSKLCQHFLFANSPRTGMGDLIISVQALEPLPVYYPNEKEESQITTLVTQIIDLKKANPKADTLALEREIDVLVYKLYGLTYEEVKVVDAGFWLSEEEYNELPESCKLSGS